MSFARIRAPGGWVGTFAPSELDTIDDHLSKAIDGTGGGAYAPSSALVIGGAGLQLTAGLNVSAGAVAITETLGVAGDAQFFADIAVFGTANFTVSEFNGVATFNDVAAFDGVTTFNGDIHAEAIAYFDGPSVQVGHALLTDTLEVLSSAQIDGVLTYGTNGRHKKRITTATDADATYAVLTSDIVFQPASTLTAARVWTISESGAQDGMEMELTREMDTSGNTITVKRVDTSVIATLVAAGGRSCRIVRVGGVWQRMQFA